MFRGDPRAPTNVSFSLKFFRGNRDAYVWRVCFCAFFNQDIKLAFGSSVEYENFKLKLADF